MHVQLLHRISVPQCDIFWISALQNKSKGSFFFDPHVGEYSPSEPNRRRRSRPRSLSPPPIPRAQTCRFGRPRSHPPDAAASQWDAATSGVAAGTRGVRCGRLSSRLGAANWTAAVGSHAAAGRGATRRDVRAVQPAASRVGRHAATAAARGASPARCERASCSPSWAPASPR